MSHSPPPSSSGPESASDGVPRSPASDPIPPAIDPNSATTLPSAVSPRTDRDAALHSGMDTDLDIEFEELTAPTVVDHRALPREIHNDDASPEGPVKGPHGNRIPLERKSGEGLKPFTRFVTRPETTVAANTATDVSPSERVISSQQPGPAFGKIRSNDELNYRPNRLQTVINDTWTYSPLTWLDQLGRVRLITGLVIICGIVAGVLWKFGVEVRRQRDKDEPVAVVAAPVDPGPRQAAIRRAFESYLAVGTLAEKLPKVLDPQRVESRMKEFYQERGEKDPVVPSFDVSLPVRAAGEWWFRLQLHGAEGRSSSVLMKETADGGQLDWENFVAYGSMPWSRFAAEKPSEPQSLRVLLKPSSRHAGKYTEAGYYSFEIAHSSGLPTLQAYVSRSSRTGLELAKLPPDSDWQSMNLYLKWEKDASAPQSVLISDVIRNNWLDAVNNAKPEDGTAAPLKTTPSTDGTHSAPVSAASPAPATGAAESTLPPAAATPSQIQQMDAFPSRAAKNPAPAPPDPAPNPLPNPLPNPPDPAGKPPAG